MEVPATFGGFAKDILRKLCNTGDEVHFICDRYPDKSTKRDERAKRALQIIVQASDFKVTGPDQRRPRDFHSLLKSSVFKTSFLKFLAEEWQKDSYANIIGKRRLVMGVEDVCYTFTVMEDESVIRSTNEDLACNHEEADTQIVLHLAYLSKQTIPNVVIRCNDTDVFIILLYHFGTDNIKANVRMDAGMDSSNTRRFIDMTFLVTLLGKSLCSALPGLHSFTGSDYTSAFLRKGKVCPLQLMENSTPFVNAFTELGKSPFLTSCYPDILEAFVCTLYGKHNMQ